MSNILPVRILLLLQSAAHALGYGLRKNGRRSVVERARSRRADRIFYSRRTRNVRVKRAAISLGHSVMATRFVRGYRVPGLSRRAVKNGEFVDVLLPNVIRQKDAARVIGRGLTKRRTGNGLVYGRRGLRWARTGGYEVAEQVPNGRRVTSSIAIWLGAVVALGYLALPASAQAATLYWVGGNGDNLTENANDWSTTNPSSCNDGGGDASAVPGSSDVAILDPDCDSNGNIAANWSIQKLEMQSGYTGTVTQNNSVTLTMHVTTGGDEAFVIAGGTFVGGDSKILVSNGDFNMSGGTFTNSSGGMDVHMDFTWSGGTYTDSGVVNFIDTNYSHDTTVTCSGTLGGTITIDKEEVWGGGGGVAAEMAIGSGCTVDLGADPTSNFAQYASEIGMENDGTMIISSGTWTTGGTGGAEFYNDGTIDHNGDGWDMNQVDFYNRSGATVTYDGSAMSVERNFDQSGTFDLSGITITFDDSSHNEDTTVTCSGNLGGTVVITKTESWGGGGGVASEFNVASGCSINLGANPTTQLPPAYDSMLDNNGTIVIESGTWTVTGALTLNNDGTIQTKGDTLSLTNSTLVHGTGSTIEFIGDGDSSADTFTISSFDTSFENLTINSTDGATDTFDLGADIDIDGNFTLTAGTFDVTTTGCDTGTNPCDMNVEGNWSNSGTFTARTGTVTLDGTDHTITGSTTFYNLSKTESADDSTDETITFDNTAEQTISGTWTLDGRDADDEINLVSDSPGTQWDVDVAGSVTLDRISVTDSNNTNATAVICSDNCTDGGNNTNWSIPFGGTVYTDEGSTNIGANKTVAITINGGSKITDETDSNGKFSVSPGTTINEDDIITVFLDGETEQGVTITVVNDLSDLGVMDIYQNRLILRAETSKSLTNTNLATADDNGDSDITDFYSISGSNLTVSDGIEMLVWTGDTFAPGGTVTADDVDINGTFTMAGNAVTVSGSWDATGGTFTGSSNTVTFDSTTTETITSNSNSFAGLTLNGSSLHINLQDALDVDDTLTIASGSTLDANSYGITNTGGTFANNGTFRMLGSESHTNLTNDTNSGTTLFDGTGTYTSLGSVTTFYHLTFNGSGGSWTLAAAIDVDGNFTITNGTVDTKSGSNYDISVAGSWTNNGTFNEQEGTVTFDGSGTITEGGSFYNVTVNSSSTGPVGHWKFDTGSGTTATDSGSGGNDGTLTNGPTWSASPTNDITFTNPYALDFDGDDDYVSTSTDSAYTLSNDGTISLWVKFDDLSESASHQLVGTQAPSSDYRDGFLLNQWDNDLLVYWTSAAQRKAHGNALSEDTWLHIAVTNDSGTMQTFLNGAALGDSYTSGGSITDTVAIGIGGHTWETVDGIIDDVRVYGRALSSAEVANLANGYEDDTLNLGAALDVNNNITLTSGTLDVTTSNYAITVANNWTNNGGTFTARTGTVTLDGTDQTVGGTSGTTFYNLSKTESADDSTDETLTFTASTTQTITNTWTLDGRDADDQINLVSSSPGTRWSIDPQSTRTLDFITITDSNNTNATTILCSNDCTNGGNNVGWAFPATITVYTDEGSTNIGADKTVAVSVDGGTKSTAETDSDGVASFTDIAFSSGSVIALWLDDETENGMTVSITNGTTLGFDIYQNRLRLQYETGSSITNANLATADNSADDDITAIYTVSGSDVTVADGIELFVNASDTYAPGGEVIMDDIDINGTFTMAGNDVVTSGSWDATGGAFSGTGSQTTTFDSNASETITSNGSCFNNLTYDLGESGDLTNADTLCIDGTITVRGTNIDSGGTDTTSPTISSLAVTAGETKATVTWTTNESADSKVEYGTSDSLGSEVTDSTDSLNHGLQITSLSAGTKYYYKVTSIDPSGNSTSSSTNTFTTKEEESTTDATSPSISGVTVANITGSGAKITWATDENTTSLVDYGTSTSYNNSAGTGTGSTTAKAFTAQLSGLSASTTYHYRIVAVDEAGNKTTGSDRTFTTTADDTPDASEAFTSTDTNEGVDPPDLSSEAPAVTNITGTSVTISWDTDEDATSAVYYRVKGSSDDPIEVSKGSFTQTHSITLTGLTRSTEYEYAVESTDTGGNTFRSKTYQFTTSLPNVSNLTVQQLADHAATFAYLTDAPTPSIIELTNLVTGDIVTVEDQSLALDHVVPLTDLDPDTTYRAAIFVEGADGTVAEALTYLFATQEDTLNPLITTIETRSALAEGAEDLVQVIFTWVTNEPSTSQVEYNEGLLRGDNTEFAHATEQTEDYVTKHVVVLTDLAPSTVYQYRVKSVDKSGNEQVSESRVLLTPAHRVSAFDLIIRNLEDTFGWTRRLRPGR